MQGSSLVRPSPLGWLNWLYLALVRRQLRPIYLLMFTWWIYPELIYYNLVILTVVRTLGTVFWRQNFYFKPIKKLRLIYLCDSEIRSFGSMIEFSKIDDKNIFLFYFFLETSKYLHIDFNTMNTILSWSSYVKNYQDDQHY